MALRRRRASGRRPPGGMSASGSTGMFDIGRTMASGLSPARGGGPGSIRLAAPRVAAPLIVGVLFLALTAGQAVAGTDEALDLRYRFTWAGVPLAQFGLRHATHAVIYQTELEIETTGLADQLFGFRSMSRATGPYRAPDRFSASRFRSVSASNRKSRRILIRFDPDTGDVIDLQMTRSGEPDRSKVPPALQKGVVDPLTALIQLRQRLVQSYPYLF